MSAMIPYALWAASKDISIAILTYLETPAAPPSVEFTRCHDLLLSYIKTKYNKNTLTGQRLLLRGWAAGIFEIVSRLGTTALLSRNMLQNGRQSPLPNNQWELEVESWYKASLADLKRSILELSTGPIDPAMRRFLVRPNTTETKKICANQKIRSNSFISVNLLGLTIIFAAGTLIIIVSLVLPIAVEHFQPHHNRYSSLEWITNDTLQLRRLAHEAVGAGTWKGATDDYPTTTHREMLAILDLTDPKHPRLKAADMGDTKFETVRTGKEEDPVTSVTVAESSDPDDRHDVSSLGSGRSFSI
jgi:hypothetical protein